MAGVEDSPPGAPLQGTAAPPQDHQRLGLIATMTLSRGTGHLQSLSPHPKPVIVMVAGVVVADFPWRWMQHETYCPLSLMLNQENRKRESEEENDFVLICEM